MPMVELTTTKGALDDAATQRLAAELSTIALELEAAPFADFGDAPHMQALAWCFANEQEVFVGGRPHPKPIYRVTVTIPEGAPGLFGPLAQRGREKLVKRVTAAVLAAEGSEASMAEAHRVWVHLRGIPDGHTGQGSAKSSHCPISPPTHCRPTSRNARPPACAGQRCSQYMPAARHEHAVDLTNLD
jgi:phenylpyruvate tautomerase PptA (4-oxalocrotonate tautomerase family)